MKNPSRPFTPADPLRRLNSHTLVRANLCESGEKRLIAVQLNPGDSVIPPPTPLLSTGRYRTLFGSQHDQLCSYPCKTSFELERPFTGIGKVPLRSTRQALDSSLVSSRTASDQSVIETKKTQESRSQSTEVLTILDVM